MLDSMNCTLSKNLIKIEKIVQAAQPSESIEQMQYYQGGSHHHSSLLMLQKSPPDVSASIFPSTADRVFKGLNLAMTSAKKSTAQVMPAHGGAATTSCKKHQMIMSSTLRKEALGNPLISEITGRELFKQPIDRKKASIQGPSMLPIMNKHDHKSNKLNSKTSKCGSLEVSFPHTIKNSQSTKRLNR